MMAAASSPPMEMLLDYGGRSMATTATAVAAAIRLPSDVTCRRAVTAAATAKGRHAQARGHAPTSVSPSSSSRHDPSQFAVHGLRLDHSPPHHPHPHHHQQPQHRHRHSRQHQPQHAPLPLERTTGVVESSPPDERLRRCSISVVATSHNSELPTLSTLLHDRRRTPRILRDASSQHLQLLRQQHPQQQRDGEGDDGAANGRRRDGKPWKHSTEGDSWRTTARPRAAPSSESSVRELYAALSHADRVSLATAMGHRERASTAETATIASHHQPLQRDWRLHHADSASSITTTTTSRSNSIVSCSELELARLARRSDPSSLVDDDAESCKSRDSHSSSSSPQQHAASLSSSSSSFTKNSRYLREMDRRVILQRLANGEKQATLAKEFQVSRAAICNLFKHRHEILSRANENPFAKHPKKRKHRKLNDSNKSQYLESPRAKKRVSLNVTQTTTSATATTTAAASSTLVVTSSSPTSTIVSRRMTPTTTSPLFVHDARAIGRPPTGLHAITSLHEIKSRSVQLLLTILRDPSTVLAEFRRCCDRVLRLVIEEALAVVATQTIEVALTEHRKISGIGARHPPCAISLEQRHCPMVDLFHLLEPHHPVGYVRLSHGHGRGFEPSAMIDDAETETAPCVPDIHFLDADLPLSLARHNVFLFDLVVSSGETMCAVIQRVKQRGAVECMIHVVALLVAADAVAMVQRQHPSVKIVTAQVHASSCGASVSSSSGSSSSSGAGSVEDASAVAVEIDGVLQRFEQVFGDAVGDDVMEV